MDCGLPCSPIYDQLQNYFNYLAPRRATQNDLIVRVKGRQIISNDAVQTDYAQVKPFVTKHCLVIL